MAKGPTYGEFSFPKSDVTYVRGYARGGKVAQAKVSKVMHEFGEGKLHSGSKSGPVVQSRKQAVAIGMSEGRKAAAGKYNAGGMVTPPAKPNIPKPKDSLTPPPRPADSAPKKLLGEQMGWPKKNEIGKQTYAKGGMVHADAKQDKAMIKKAVGMHDTQLHGGKHTNLAKLKAGGRVYAKGGMVDPMAPKVPKPMMKSKAPKAPKAPKQAMGALGQMAGPPPGGPMMKAGGMIGKQAKMKPKANFDSPPKSINVKSRMSAGVGSVENLKCGGYVNMKKG